MSDLPFVSAIIVTGKVPPAEDWLTPVAVRSIIEQTYRPLELVIVSDREHPLPFMLAPIAFPTQLVRAAGPLGDLRNAGLEAARGELTVQADSDDFHHQERIETQVHAYLNQNKRPGYEQWWLAEKKTFEPVFLKRQLCYNWRTDTAFVRELPGLPIFGTILHPNDGKRYPSLKATEDTAFASQYPGYAILDNDPCLYVRFFHGGNTTAERDVMRGHTEPGKWDLTDEQAEYLRGVLAKYPKGRNENV